MAELNGHLAKHMANLESQVYNYMNASEEEDTKTENHDRKHGLEEDRASYVHRDKQIKV